MVAAAHAQRMNWRRLSIPIASLFAVHGRIHPTFDDSLGGLARCGIGITTERENTDGVNPEAGKP
jgi:hypothetical protein